MGYQQENSVIRALSDIYHIEDERIQRERQQQEAAKAARIEAAARAARREAEQKVEEARLRAEQHRIQEEMAARDHESAQRIAALKAELEAVRWSREAIQSEVHAIGVRRARGYPTLRRNPPWLWGSLVIAACGFGLLLGWMNSRPEIAPAMATVEADAAGIGGRLKPVEASPEVASKSKGIQQESSVNEKVIEEKIPAKARPQVAKMRPPRQGRKPVAKSKRPVATKTKETKKDNDLDFFDKCGLDPMCGFDRSKKK